MKNSNFGENTDIFMSELFVGRPGPTLNEPGMLQVAVDNMVDCFNRGAGKSCHIIGQVYLFGEAFIHDTPLNEEEIAFAKVSFHESSCIHCRPLKLEKRSVFDLYSKSYTLFCKKPLNIDPRYFFNIILQQFECNFQAVL